MFRSGADSIDFSEVFCPEAGLSIAEYSGVGLFCLVSTSLVTLVRLSGSSPTLKHGALPAVSGGSVFLGRAPCPGCSVFLGARFAPGPVRYRGVRAVSAEAQFLGLTPFFLGKEPGALLVLWGLVFQPVVIDQLLPLGFDLGRGWLGTAFRLSGFGSGLLLRFADGGFPWWLSGWGLPGLGTVPAVVLWELEGVLEKTSFCRGGARECGGTLPLPLPRLPSPGLSPRERGNLLFNGYVHHPVGSIPASAGEP